MPKARITVSIDQEVMEMLTTTVEQEGESQSATVERAIRHYCADYVPHVVEVSRLEGGRRTISLDRRGRRIFTRRGVRRHTSAHVLGVVRVEMPGPFKPTVIGSLLRHIRADRTTIIRSGLPVEFAAGEIVVRVSALPLAADDDPNFVNELLDEAASQIVSMEVSSLRQIITRRCPRCAVPFVELRVWDPPDGTAEFEWVCGVGHEIGPVGAFAKAREALISQLDPDHDGEEARASIEQVGSFEELLALSGTAFPTRVPGRVLLLRVRPHGLATLEESSDGDPSTRWSNVRARQQFPL